MSEDIIVSTKDRPGEYDALETAKPGELIFTLQSGDPLAAHCIERWARMARRAALKMPEGEDQEAMLKKATSAELVAWKFREYYAAIQRGEDPAEQEAAPIAKTFESEDVSDRNVILARAADRLNNSVGEAVMVAEALERLGDDAMFDGVNADIIRAAANALKAVSGEIEPRRHMRRG